MTEFDNCFYHVTGIKLQESSVILPGNYGRIINKMGPGHISYPREILLESICCKDYPNKPSRLSSNFICDHQNDAKFFIQHHCPMGIIYKIILLDKSAKQHIGCYNYLPPLPLQFNKTPEEVAHDYWKGKFIEVHKAPKCKEIVTESAIKIVDIVTKL